VRRGGAHGRRGVARESGGSGEAEETRPAALRAALIEGETSGASTPLDFEAFIARKLGAPTAPR
jgi:antitoxin ParD1/3/4